MLSVPSPNHTRIAHIRSYLQRFLGLLFVGGLLFRPHTILRVDAQEGGGPVTTGLQNIMNPLPASMTEGTIATFVITIINWFLGILGIVFLIIVLYAGFKYMIAQAPQGAQEARTLLTNAVIGLVIIFGAYLITQYVAGAFVS